ncbi:MAG: MFS transporter [Candidatus Binatia bacterium]|nr:MFS transporter [Candidatus Binatia bacterium]
MKVSPAGGCRSQPAGRAVLFIVLLGLVSLCADVTYEGARSIIGPYLGSLGASALTVAVVAGGGELLGYVLRLWSGVLADRTQAYWLLTIAGYTVNVLSVPALALTGHWVPAAGLVLLERTGKALRTPARDAMLSFATARTGHGWGFGLHEVLDQFGATLGPLVVAGIVAAQSNYREAFAWLLLPAFAALAFLTLARILFPRPRELHVAPEAVVTTGLPPAFWVYVVGAACVAAGYADYPLVAYHFQQSGHVSAAWIATLYALAMAVDGVSALLFGWWFDRAGMRALLVAVGLSALAPVWLFSQTFAAAAAGVILWGIGIGAQESVLRAVVAHLTPHARRGSAFGVFNMVFGLAWFAGSGVLGFLYTHSLPALVFFATAMQLAALPLFWRAEQVHRHRRG